jgi:hypothetical protein
MARTGARGGDELEGVRGCEVPVAADVALFRPDDEHDQVHVADARDAAWRGRLDVHDASWPELERAAGDLGRRTLRKTPSPISSIEPYEYATGET